jgi:exonuclease V gamma subunit
MDSTVAFDPLDPSQAKEELRHLLTQFSMARNTPLLISCKTACTYWQTRTHLNDETKALEAAQAQFEGNTRHKGELSQDIHLQRFARRFQDIEPTLAHWSEQLYAPMLAHARLLSTASLQSFSLSESPT